MRSKVFDLLHPELAEAAPLAEHGGDHKSEGFQGNNVTLNERGNSESYALRRLKRDREDLADKVISGEMSANGFEGSYVALRLTSITSRIREPFSFRG